MTSRPTPMMEPGKCTEHKALVGRVDRLEEDLVRETAKRERAFDVLVEELKGANRELGKVKVDMAKLLGGIAVALALVQVVLKFIPGG